MFSQADATPVFLVGAAIFKDAPHPNAAKLYLTQNPGAYGVIRLVHGHKSVETTTRHYCGTETAAAIKRYDEHVLRLREQHSAAPRKPRRRYRGSRGL